MTPDAVDGQDILNQESCCNVASGNAVGVAELAALAHATLAYAN